MHHPAFAVAGKPFSLYGTKSLGQIVPASFFCSSLSHCGSTQSLPEPAESGCCARLRRWPADPSAPTSLKWSPHRVSGPWLVEGQRLWACAFACPRWTVAMADQLAGAAGNGGNEP